jgi:hypothetical protein
MIVNGTETAALSVALSVAESAAESVAIADAGTLTTDPLDAIGTETCSRKDPKDPGEKAESATGAATASVTAAATEESGGGVRRHLLGRGNPRPTCQM